jgi:hypothetical protein
LISPGPGDKEVSQLGRKMLFLLRLFSRAKGVVWLRPINNSSEAHPPYPNRS